MSERLYLDAAAEYLRQHGKSGMTSQMLRWLGDHGRGPIRGKEPGATGRRFYTKEDLIAWLAQEHAETLVVHVRSTETTEVA